MAGNRELYLLLNNADAIRLLGPWYAQQWLDIVRAFSRGIGRPGPARVRSLVAELRQRLAALYPRRSPFLREWMQKWVGRAFWLGVTHAHDDIEEARKKAAKDGAAVVPMVDVAEADGNQQVVAINGQLEAALQSIAVQMEASILRMVHLMRTVMLTNTTTRAGITGGIVRSDAGRAIVQDLQDIATRGFDSATARRLIEQGIPSDVITQLDRVNMGVVVSLGKTTQRPETVATAKATGAVLDGYNAGILLSSQENAVLYVEIYHTHEDEICPYCLVIQYHVFYAGDAAEDPLGFPRLADLPGGGPPFHQFCNHHLRPWALFDASTNEYEERLAASLSIPQDYFGEGAVERINHGHDKRKEGAA